MQYVRCYPRMQSREGHADFLCSIQHCTSDTHPAASSASPTAVECAGLCPCDIIGCLRCNSMESSDPPEVDIVELSVPPQSLQGTAAYTTGILEGCSPACGHDTASGTGSPASCTGTAGTHSAAAQQWLSGTLQTLQLHRPLRVFRASNCKQLCLLNTPAAQSR